MTFIDCTIVLHIHRYWAIYTQTGTKSTKGTQGKCTYVDTHIYKDSIITSNQAKIKDGYECVNILL